MLKEACVANEQRFGTTPCSETIIVIAKAMITIPNVQDIARSTSCNAAGLRRVKAGSLYTLTLFVCLSFFLSNL